MPNQNFDAAIESSQLVVQIDESLNRSLREAAGALGLDLPNLVRLILTEQVAEYMERGRFAAHLTDLARENLRARGGVVEDEPPTRNLEL